jgi:hypothetical protein
MTIEQYLKISSFFNERRKKYEESLPKRDYSRQNTEVNQSYPSGRKTHLKNFVQYMDFLKSPQSYFQEFCNKECLRRYSAGDTPLLFLNS